MKCKKCGLEKPIVNKHFGLCRGCNNERLYGSKYGKSYADVKKKRKSPYGLKSSSEDKVKGSLFVSDRIKGDKKKSMIERDELFYEKCFNMSDHKCEECGKQLPTAFRDDSGKVVARWRYSHIIPKSIASELRHDVNNINHLCLECHMRWENGDKENMNIFAENSERFPQFLK